MEKLKVSGWGKIYQMNAIQNKVDIAVLILYVNKYMQLIKL